MSKKHVGSTIDDFLKEEGIFEDAQAQAVKEVVAWQLAQAMKKKKISKSRMAALLKTSRTQVDRLLDPKNDITLSSLQRAAAMVGRRLTIELVWSRAQASIKRAAELRPAPTRVSTREHSYNAVEDKSFAALRKGQRPSRIPALSGNSPGIHREVSAAGKAKRSGARELSEAKTPRWTSAATALRA